MVLTVRETGGTLIRVGADDGKTAGTRESNQLGRVDMDGIDTCVKCDGTY